jgi:hypothetical protein
MAFKPIARPSVRKKRGAFLCALRRGLSFQSLSKNGHADRGCAKKCHASAATRRKTRVFKENADRALKAASYDFIISDTFQRPVQRFLLARGVPLPDGSFLRFLPSPHLVKKPRQTAGDEPQKPPAPCVPHRHARRACWEMKRQNLSGACHFPLVAGGRPISANPVHEVLRHPLTPRAGPASPERLLVYPLRDEGIVDEGVGGEDNEARNYFTADGAGRLFVSLSWLCCTPKPPGCSLSKNQLQQQDDHDQANEKNHSDGATDELQHVVSCHMMRSGRRVNRAKRALRSMSGNWSEGDWFQFPTARSLAEDC